MTFHCGSPSERHMPLAFYNTRFGREYNKDKPLSSIPFKRTGGNTPPMTKRRTDQTQDTVLPQAKSSSQHPQLLPRHGSLAALRASRSLAYAKISIKALKQGFLPPLKLEVISHIDRPLPPTPSAAMPVSASEVCPHYIHPTQKEFRTYMQRSLPPTPGTAASAVEMVMEMSTWRSMPLTTPSTRDSTSSSPGSWVTESSFGEIDEEQKHIPPRRLRREERRVLKNSHHSN